LALVRKWVPSSLHSAGTFSGYRDNVYALLECEIRPLGSIRTAADIGSGDGWLVQRLIEDKLVDDCIGFETKRRPNVLIEPVLYDGHNIPLADRSSEIVLAVDVVHHAEDPFALLREIARVSEKWILLKDHIYQNGRDRTILIILDWIGNRRFGIPSPGNYQFRWSWLHQLQACGFGLRSLVYPARCHRGLLGASTNHLQFVALFGREARSSK
jgi:SAM-dependent methyltransferase